MVDEETARIAAALWPRIEGALDSQLVGSLRHRVAETAAATGEWVVEAARRHYRATEPLVIRGLDAALQGHRQRVNEATADVLEVANRLLGMSVRVHAVGAPLSERAGFHLRDWDYSGGPLRGSTWMLWLPRRWSVPRAHRLLRELLERRISQNLEAIRYDWSLRLDEAVRQFQRSSREQASEIAGAITAALHRSRELRQAGHAASRAAALDRDLEQVLELSRRLSSGAISD
jgi:hypothetical protein